MAAKFFHGSEKEKKEKNEEVEVSIRINKKALERTFYIVTILIMICVIVFLLFSQRNCIKPETTGGAVVEEVTAEKPAENKTETAAKVTAPKPKETPKVENKTAVKEETTPVKTTVDAELILEKDYIETEGTHPSIKTTSVKYKINNKGAKFTAKVKLRWYDKDDDATLKEKVRATDEFIIEQDAAATRTITEFSPKYLNSINDDEMFVLELYNSKDGKLLDTEKVNYYP